MLDTQITRIIESMDYINRLSEDNLHAALDRGKSVLLLGARQTGKSTLIQKFNADYSISFITPEIRQRYEKHPSLLTAEIEGLTGQEKKLVIIDEVQKVPEILDVIQDLADRKIAQFILTGSSARKLRTGKKINLLPGRIVALYLDPLSLEELPQKYYNLDNLILYGSLPGIITTIKDTDKELDLHTYVTVYLEEEIRSEAVVRDLGQFARFLELAAAESGNLVNFSKLSQEIGVAHTTIAGYYQILEDCLIAERIDPLVKTRTRRRLIKTPKYIFFDLGVRRICANEGIKLPLNFKGKLFEQFVGLELIRQLRLQVTMGKLLYWRDTHGIEVDWVIDKKGEYIPYEVKWTAEPTVADIKNLKIFLEDYPDCKKAYLICRTPRRLKLSDKIFALPWQEITIE